MKKREANAVMRQKYGNQWFERPDGRRERDALLLGREMKYEKKVSKPRPRPPKKQKGSPSIGTPTASFFYPSKAPTVEAEYRVPQPRPREEKELWVVVAGKTDQGLRDYQEDRAYGIAPIAAVADGMGGHEAGDKAAQIAIDTVKKEANRLTQLAKHGTKHQVQSLLEEVIEQANTAVYGLQTGFSRRRPGTTLIVGIADLDEGRLIVGNVGDSRCTLVHNWQALRITTDHSQVQKMVDKGILSEEEARVHPHKNIITRALGTEPRVEVDVRRVQLVPGQVFAFTSDGVHDYLTNNEFISICESSTDPKVISNKLVQVALANGSDDNSTAVVMIVEKGVRGIATAIRTNRQRSRQWAAKKNGPTRDRPHYPFAEKEEQYRTYSNAQLYHAMNDAAATSRAQEGWDQAGANWYLDDYHTIVKEIHNRKRR